MIDNVNEFIRDYSAAGASNQVLANILVDDGFSYDDFSRRVDCSNVELIDDVFTHLCDSAYKSIPEYTKQGFKKTTLSTELFSKIKSFYSDNLHNAVVEDTSDYVHNLISEQHTAFITDLSHDLKFSLHQELHDQLESWAGVSLEPTFVYGIRTYLNGSILRPHRDRIDTHVISAILNVSIDQDEEWLLYIDDHQGNTHSVTMQAGDVLFYESATLKHSRHIPFKGDHYANAFIHFKPI